MAFDWSRREFLHTGVAASALPGLITSIQAAPATTLSDPQRATLRAIADQIIPAGDGMPSASQVGGVSYLENLIVREPAMGRMLVECITILQNGRFDQLPASERVAALRKLETGSPTDFALLRDSVYEAYYTNPAVWKLIGYELFPTDHRGPHMKPFDRSVVATVSQKPRHYRQV